MIYKQIGNGDAFNHKMCNTSFLIEQNNEYILIDAGYSVYQKLKNLEEENRIDLKKLKTIYITHFDDDHIGSLKTILYYQYFINKISIDLIIDNKLKKEMINFLKKDFSKVKMNYVNTAPKIPIVNNIYIKNRKLEYKDLTLKTFKGEHHIDCYGLIVDDGNVSIAFTGDTIPTKNIENKCKKCDIIFHDYSNWNEPSMNNHACEGSINSTYSKKFINKLTYCHNSKSFESGWKEIIKA